MNRCPKKYELSEVARSCWMSNCRCVFYEKKRKKHNVVPLVLATALRASEGIFKGSSRCVFVCVCAISWIAAICPPFLHFHIAHLIWGGPSFPIMPSPTDEARHTASSSMWTFILFCLPPLLSLPAKYSPVFIISKEFNLWMELPNDESSYFPLNLYIWA